MIFQENHGYIILLLKASQQINIYVFILLESISICRQRQFLIEFLFYLKYVTKSNNFKNRIQLYNIVAKAYSEVLQKEYSPSNSASVRLYRIFSIYIAT